ncbi:Hypothetical predicted protein [Pelobates cultripes]|uniref:Uncharacterized protein n=1 Tax=Pelobates cultripes TaxID=61616 RepID=A0AAD1SWF5_PELCU|nr:Hypothetical predicted protein [Pelobates cultripes]
MTMAPKLTHLPAKPPVTEETLRDMLGELHRNIAADIGMFHEEISGVSAGLQNTELNTAAQETRLATVEQQLPALQKAHQQQQDHLVALEDKRRWKNVKVCGLPDAVETTEIPHLFCRLFSTLFKDKQAKSMPLNSWHRISRPTTSTPEGGKDVIIRFQQGRDRLALMAATRNKSPLHSEGYSLTFYPDLSKATMDWRWSLRPLTKSSYLTTYHTVRARPKA